MLPWILSLGIVAFLFLTTDLAAVGDALEGADWPRLVGLMALVTLLSFVADSATLVPLLNRFVARVGFKEVVAVKGVSYFLNVLNYSLAAGGMAWLFHRKHHVPFMRAFSALVLFFFIDIIALGLLLTSGWLFGHELLEGSGAPFVARVPIVIIVLWSIVLGAWIYWNRRFDFLVLGFFRKWRIFQCFAEARSLDYLRLVSVRVLFIMVYVVMHLVLLPTFGVHIPFEALLMYAPLIAFVQVMPATISGLGAAQGVMVALFAAHIPPGQGDPRAIIIAYSTVIGPLMTIMRLIIGYCFVAAVTRDVLPSSAEIALAQREGTTPGDAPAPAPGAQGDEAASTTPKNAVGTSDT